MAETTQTFLELRRRIKAKKPTFIRQDAHKKPRIPFTWRKPKGRHSKMRRGFKGKPEMPSAGWGSPAAVYGLHPGGLNPVVVSSATQLDALQPKKDGAVIQHSVGRRKRVAIIKAAQEKKIKVLNIRDAQQYVKETEQHLKERKEKRAQKLQEKKEEKKKEEKKGEGKKEEKVELQEIKEKKAEAQKEEERKLMEEIITKPQ